MKKYLKYFAIFFPLACLIPIEGYTDVGLGIGYPFIGLKYDFIQEISAELKYANTGEGINVLAGRGYWNFIRAGSLSAFSGIEVGGMAFDIQDVKGNGIEYAVFLGGEYRIIPALGIALDISPTVINLNSQNNNSSGLEWVITAGVYWYVF